MGLAARVTAEQKTFYQEFIKENTPVQAMHSRHEIAKGIEGPRQHIIKVGKVFAEYLKEREGVKSSFKLTTCFIDWWKTFSHKALPDRVNNLRNVTVDGKNLVGVTEIPEKTVQLIGRISDLANVRHLGELPHAVKEVISSASGYTGPICDALKLGVDRKIVNVSSDVMKNVGIVGCAGLFVGTAISAGDEFGKIVKAHEKFQTARTASETRMLAHQVALALINFIKFSSYVGLGLLGFASAVNVITVASPVMLSLGTSALLCTIGGSFYKKINHITTK